MSLWGCRQHAADLRSDAAAPTVSVSFQLDASVPTPVRGMVWIEPGPLVVGTAPNVYPRRPDRELPGEQFVMRGFYIDLFPYPNEEGAIPTTNVTQAQAQALCGRAGKRLCTELEWERACKGPFQHTYEYGDQYREETCGTGVAVTPRPSGLRVGCKSDFGVMDMHGGVFEWTQSHWGRGAGNADWVVTRGGNQDEGQLVARCANAEPRVANTASAAIGFRCCAGEANTVEISMRVDRGDAMSSASPVDGAMLQRLLTHAPPEIASDLRRSEWDGLAAYSWRPLGNERLDVLVVCARRARPPSCGVLVGRDTPGFPTVLGYADTGYATSKLYVDVSPDDVWLLGTDNLGRYRRLVHYDWGVVTVSPKYRNVAPPDTKHAKKKRKRHTSKRGHQ